MRLRHELIELHNRLTHPAVKQRLSADPAEHALVVGILATIDWVLLTDRSHQPEETLDDHVDRLMSGPSPSALGHPQ